MGFADDAVASVVGRMPLLHKPREARRTMVVNNDPLDFYGAKDGMLHANGDVFHVKGINWYGTEGKQMMLEGLHVKPIDRIFDFLVEHEFNAMRLLFNMQDWRDDPPVPQDHFSAELNPEFVGLSYRQMLLTVTRLAARRGILVLLACHRIRRFYSDGIHAEWPTGWDGWWFDDKVGLGMAKMESLWQEMAHVFCGEWNVFASDLFNEPSVARWNTRGSNDWVRPLADWATLSSKDAHDCSFLCREPDGKTGPACPTHVGAAALPMHAASSTTLCRSCATRVSWSSRPTRTGPRCTSCP